jgi:hypothetical protein
MRAIYTPPAGSMQRPVFLDIYIYIKSLNDITFTFKPYKSSNFSL